MMKTMNELNARLFISYWTYSSMEDHAVVDPIEKYDHELEAW